MTNPAKLLDALPPFQFDRDIKVKKQTTDNIIVQVLNSHRQHEKDYDLIADYFEGGNSPKKLFDFCKRWLIYSEEQGSDQTTRSPAGILTLAEYSGVDCKHYANFIAGVLDALNRKGHNVNWCYRFVSYKTKGKDKKESDHVYVVDLDNDVWIDPAPLRDQDGSYYERSFNDRYAIPVFYMDIKMDDMLSHLSGVHYYINEDNPQGQQPGGCMGALELQYLFDPVVTQSVATVNTVQNTAGQLASDMLTGGLQGFLMGIFNSVTAALTNLIKGRTYTTGGYQLAEIFMRNILGMSEIQNNRQVPDEYVPIAEQFFTTALGLEIGSGDHLNELVKSADAYYAWMPPEVDKATPREVAERASRILKLMNYGPAVRDRTWNLEWFVVEPYIYPIPDVQVGHLFTGTHPITGLKMLEGFPEIIEPMPADELPPPDKPTNGTDEADDLPEPGKQTPGVQTAGMGKAAAIILGLVAVGFLASGSGNRAKRKRKRK